jgi:23S rRNA (uracil1939-C5)-methyltransferase
VRCAWQHIAYTAQPLLKQDVLAEHLSRIAGLSSPPVEATIPALQPWAFLHHATWQVSEGRLLLPGRMGGSVPHRECALLHPDLLDLYAQLDFTAQDLADVSRVRLQRGSDGGRMLILSVRTEAAPELELDTDVSVNLILPDNEPVNLVGESAVRLQVGDAWLRATAGAYFRPNVPMLGVLAHTVRVLLQVQPGEAVLDLYAGIGVFSHALAVDAARVTLVESYPPAVTDADENLRAFEHIDVIEGGVEAVLPALDGPYAAAVIDPPRGMADEVIAEVERLGVRRALILADDPAEAGRHVRRMRRRGWTLARALAIDLMPQTAFVDSILLFHRE